MFAGIVERTSEVISAEVRRECRCVRIRKPASWKLKKGQSVSVDGICSTVVVHASTSFDVEYMPETLSKTTAAHFVRGMKVNLERSLRYGDRVDGHLLQGHVDTCARIAAVVEKGRSRDLIVVLPRKIQKHVVLRGSIAINGVSLTVARKIGTTIAVALIPYTLTHTNLGLLEVGDRVNIEFDHTVSLAPRAAHGTVARNEAKGVRKRQQAEKRL